jgi:hypothetical protein
MSVPPSTHHDAGFPCQPAAIALSPLVILGLGLLSGGHWLQHQAIELGQRSETLFLGRTLPRLPFPQQD